MDAIILARVSSKDQEENYSIPSQVFRLKEYCKTCNLHIIEIVSLVESSTKGNRAKFQSVLKFIRRYHKPIALVADTIDRVQRGFNETGPLLELTKSGRLEIHFYRERLVINQNSTNADLMRWDFGTLQAKSYVTQLSDNVKRGQEEKLRNGEWLSRAPFGYKNIHLENGKTWIVPDENAPIVRKLFQCYATGVCSINELRKILKDTYSITKPSSKIHKLLNNPFYCGSMNVKGKIYTHKYEPIITQDLFDAVQDVFLSRHRNKPVYSGKNFVYRSIFTCKECGCIITAEQHKGHIYYHCTQHKGKHGAKWIREEKLTQQIQDLLAKISPSEAEYKETIQTLRHRFDYNISTQKQLKQLISSKLALNKTKTSRLLDKYLDGMIDDEIYKTKNDELKTEKTSLEKHLLELSRLDNSWFNDLKELIALVKDAPLLFSESSRITEKRQILKLLFSNLQISGDSLCCTWKKPFDRMAFSTNNVYGWG